MAFTIKDWRNFPDQTTPITAEAIEDMELRVSDYTDQEVQILRDEVDTGGTSLLVGDSAGGDLTGTYPNPQLAANSVGTAEIANTSVTLGKVAADVGTGREMGYAEITAAPTGNATAVFADIAGLAITVTVAARPIMLQFYAPFVTNTVASGGARFAILRTSTLIQEGTFTNSAVFEGGPMNILVRDAPAAGSYTYKVQWRVVTAGGGSSTVLSLNAGAKAFIAAVER